MLDVLKWSFATQPYQSLQQRSSLFWFFLHLLWKSKMAPGEPLTLGVLGLKFSANCPRVLWQLFVEIFIWQVYQFSWVGKKLVIIDAGANIGMSVMYFKFIYPDAMITAIEPNPEAFLLLKKNISQNKLKDIKLIAACLSDHTDGETLCLGNSSEILNGNISGTQSKTVKIACKSVRLPDLLQEIKPDLVKMDIEGAEKRIWKDLIQSRTFGRSPLYVVEYHFQGEPKESLEKWVPQFKALGYQTRVIYPSKEQDPLVWIKKETLTL